MSMIEGQAQTQPLNQRLTKAHRIKKRDTFREVLDHGQKVVSAHFVLFHRPADDPRTHHGQVGIIVTKKIGNAVVRNHLKRIIRECFRRSGILGRTVYSGDFVVIVRARARSASLEQIDRSLNWAQRQLKVKEDNITPPSANC